jgi:hypothetical protein
MAFLYRFSTLRNQRTSFAHFGRYLGILLAFGWLSAAAAQPLASWPLAPPDNGTPTPVDVNVSAGNFTGGPGLGNLNYNANGVRASGWSTAGLQTDDYFEIAISPAAGYNLLITDLLFDESRNNNGIRNYEVRWSKDANFGTFTTIAAVAVPDNNIARIGDINGLDIPVVDGETLYFRWYGYNAESAQGTWQLEDNSLSVRGTTTQCGIAAVGPVVLNCQSTDPDINTDAVTLSIPYTGREPGLTVSASVVGGGVLTVGGDDPATVIDGTIEISGPGLLEGSEYLVTLTSADCSFTLNDVVPADFCQVDCQLFFPQGPVFDCQTSTDGTDLVDILILYVGQVPGASIDVEPNLTVLGDSPGLFSPGIIQIVGAQEGQTYTVTITDGTTCVTRFSLTVPTKLCTEKTNRPFINEIHYDDSGDPDDNEFVEIAVPTAGPFSTFPLSSFTVVLYDGATGNPYDSESVANMTPGTPTQDYQFYVWKPAEIQNGSPDGLALLASGFVIELLSYEGTFTANGLPASGNISTDIGVMEDGSDPPGSSLQRVGSCAPVITDCPEGLVWMGPIPQTEGMINTGQLLPITLLDFTATPEAATVRLDWATASEIDNDYFAIERSADGREFRSIGVVPGRGTTDREVSYVFHDERPLPGRSYYRLRQVDFDGTTELFGPVAVDRTGRGDVPVRVYPNPTRGDWVTLEGELRAGSSAQLLDMTGRILRHWSFSEPELRRELPVGELAPGVYFLRLQDGNDFQTLRLVRQ